MDSLLDYPVLVGFWAICGFVTGVVATSRGKDGCVWFVFGVLLGPFGIILALVTAPDREQLEKKATASGEMRKCPACAELVRREAIKCRYCGEALPAAPAPEPETFIAGVPGQHTRRFNCQGCGAGRPYVGSVEIGGVRYCASCAAART